MKQRLTLGLLLGATTLLTACGASQMATETGGTPEQQQAIEQRVSSGDGMGHGPDIGSTEWQAVIASKLGIENHPNLPAADANHCCAFVAQHIQ